MVKVFNHALVVCVKEVRPIGVNHRTIFVAVVMRVTGNVRTLFENRYRMTSGCKLLRGNASR
jgi:hypothetical protein